MRKKLKQYEKLRVFAYVLIRKDKILQKLRFWFWGICNAKPQVLQIAS